MDPNIIKAFADFGIIGAVLFIVIYDVFILQKKLWTLIENNTKAMTELKSSIETCQKIHDDGK